MPSIQGRQLARFLTSVGRSLNIEVFPDTVYVRSFTHSIIKPAVELEHWSIFETTVKHNVLWHFDSESCECLPFIGYQRVK